MPGLEAAPAACRRVADADDPDTLGEDAFVLVMLLLWTLFLSGRRRDRVGCLILDEAAIDVPDRKSWNW